jgi:hypothetical protein
MIGRRGEKELSSDDFGFWIFEVAGWRIPVLSINSQPWNAP